MTWNLSWGAGGGGHRSSQDRNKNSSKNFRPQWLIFRKNGGLLVRESSKMIKYEWAKFEFSLFVDFFLN
jgi:hypothetical protein